MKVKKALRNAFTPPKPQSKDNFIKTIRYPRMSYFEFILLQICYIRKRIWIFSIVLLLISLGTVYFIPQNKIYAVWTVSAFIPFLALLTATEISRSDIFGMSEIESGCRFSMPQLSGARMIILGACDFTVIPIIAVILGFSSPLGIIKTALYILIPFITVNGISLAILNKANGSDGIYISVAATVGVSLVGVLPFSRIDFDERLINTICAALCIVGLIVIAVQVKKIMAGKDNCYGIKRLNPQSSGKG